MTILIFIALFYLAVNLLGLFLEKIKIPTIYGALFLGIAVSGSQIIHQVTLGQSFKWLSNTGMILLLLLIGFNINLKELKNQSLLIIKSVFFIISAELLVGTLFLHFILHVNWLLAAIIAISFSTVGEIALLPILKEFNLLKTRLGQIILGIGILDDVVEILSFFLVLIYISGLKFSELIIQSIPVLAIFSGILIYHLLKQSRKFGKLLELAALTVFGPFFFFNAGTETSLGILLSKFWMIILLTLLIKISKISSAYLSTHKQLGAKKSVILGISLGIKFSTSIIILMILLQKNLITNEVFSVLIGVKILFKFVVPILLSYLLNKWKLHFKYIKEG